MVVAIEPDLDGHFRCRLRTMAAHASVKIVMLGLLWGYLHHLCAGIRHLAMDLDFATELPSARLTSKLVFAVSIAVTVVIGALLW